MKFTKAALITRLFVFFCAMDQRFGKKEKLKSLKEIEGLFSAGKQLRQFPLMLVYGRGEGEAANKAGFTVSRRKFKKAHERNRIKRLMREAYRLQKHHLATDESLRMMFIYLPAEELKYARIFEAMGKILEKLKNDLSPQSTP